MSQKQKTGRTGSAGFKWTLMATLCCALLMPGAVVVSQTREPVGRVVSVRGFVFAQEPGEERRVLQCRDPIYDGDRVLTLDDSDVGIDSGSYYVRLGSNTTTEVGALASGAPRLDLVQGHLRLIDSDGGAGASAEVLTPGLRVARTGADQDALVFAEKAGTVSMVCSYGGPLPVARRSDPLTVLEALPGGCVVGKPREALFAAQATHPQLAVLMRDACEELAGVPVSDRFSLADVSLGPLAGAGGGGTPAPGPPVFGSGLAQPCSGGGCTPSSGPTALPTQFPFVPPVLPPTP